MSPDARQDVKPEPGSWILGTAMVHRNPVIKESFQVGQHREAEEDSATPEP
jgi:hypothetical protein